MARRFELRHRLTRPIDVISSAWDEPLGFATGDLSPRGAFIESEILPELGENIVCSFDLGAGCAFDFFAEVVRVNLMRRRADECLWPGFGVRFLDAKPLDRLRIRDALRNAPPLPLMRKPPRTSGLIAQSRADGSIKPQDYWFWDATRPPLPRLPRIA